MSELEINVSKPYKPLWTFDRSKVRYILLEGGRAGGRSYEASQFMTAEMLRKEYFRGVIMRQIYATVKDSNYQEIVDRIDDWGINDQISISQSPLGFKMGKKKIDAKAFQASSKTQTAKAKSITGYNVVWIEEAEEIDEHDFDQLDVSLRKKGVDIIVILSFNPPVKGHWILNRWFDLIPSEHDGYFNMKLKSECDDALHIHATYKDNIKNLNESSIKKFESFQTYRPDYYKHMILGLVPSMKTGLIFKNWRIISDQEYAECVRAERLGMDFGYNDPTTLIGVKKADTKLYVDQKLYEIELDVDMIKSKIEAFKNEEITADSSAKQAIETLKGAGYWLKPSVKGADSIVDGIRNMQSYEILVTESSAGLIEELQNYCWETNQNKELKDKPKDEYNHAIDAIRYAIEENTAAVVFGSM